MLSGQLFTEYFLTEGIRETEAWGVLTEEQVETVRATLVDIYTAFPVGGTPNEGQTEQDLIFPILEKLGWDHFLTQQTANVHGRSDVPDMLLFSNEEDKVRANNETQSAHKYRHGLAICENKAWQLPLDRAGGPGSGQWGAPSTQILRYLTIAEVQSSGRILWGMLTNGRHWRLYFQLAHSRSEQFLELDLPSILGLPGFESLFLPNEDARQHWLKVFLLMFRRDSFIPLGVPGETFHALALNEGRLWEERVSKDLSDIVFGKVYPDLIHALARHDPEAPAELNDSYLVEVKEAALILLYRLLFVLYAEDRNLLPVRDHRYDDYGMRETVRKPIAVRMDQGDIFSGAATNYYSRMRDLFRIIDRGDASIGVPPYNGGLFDPERTPLLERTALPDADFAPVIEVISRRAEGAHRHWINYRDLSVQQLGSIYERLLEFEPVIEDGGIRILPNIFARKGSGSYYTPEELVRLIVDRTIGPLVRERRDAFLAKVDELAAGSRPETERLSELAEFDSPSAILSLRICDPAMGSGHFLVSLVDYLADNILEAMAEAESAVHWAAEDEPYRSPLAQRIETLRSHILDQANAMGWTVAVDQLDDRLLVRRIILKRVIHGVDLNPMAVELAKVSLWLHTFTVGAPLSFLDHHVRCGNSLFGEKIGPVWQELASSGLSLLLTGYIERAMHAAEDMHRIEELPDINIGEVQDSVAAFQQVIADTIPLWRILDLKQSLRWLGVNDVAARRLPAPVQSIFSGEYGDLVALASEGMPGEDDGESPDLAGSRMSPAEIRQNAARTLGRALALARQERFLHWEVVFPGIWRDWNSGESDGGFDAIIGNPPWDRMKLQEVEWFAARRSDIARAQTAAARKRMIRQLRSHDDPLVEDYERARWTAESATRVARNQGAYPLLSGGDINIYSLFVERALSLINPEGMVGLLVPSGIAGDKSASAFFKSIATTGRLECLFDFENRRPNKPPFFPDVDGRFKFCALIAGGERLRFAGASCAFFLSEIEQSEDPERSFVLNAQDFANINPNTGTAPVFRTRRDAKITRDIYSRVPVLVDRRGAEPEYVWPVKYVRMFDMTNDSGLFRTADQLEEEGAYRVAGSLWRRGDEHFLPLYEGKMVQAFDHRAASVVVNPENLHRPAQPQAATLEQHQDTEWSPNPQFWISRANIHNIPGLQWALGFKDITAPTNVRTMIAALVPYYAFGNKLPLLLPQLPNAPQANASSEELRQWQEEVEGKVDKYKNWAPLLLANLCSFVLDFVAREKVQGQTLNLFIVEQLPVLSEEMYSPHFGDKQAFALVSEEVIKLTYTAHDMEPFARDLGFEGEPFIWDEEERRHSRARLDALYFLLYGLNRDDAAYIMETFPIVKQQDIDACGHYRTRELILGYMAAFAAGDTESRIVL